MRPFPGIPASRSTLGRGFWSNPWCTFIPLNRLYPSIFSLALDKEGSVKDHMIHTRFFCSWNLQLRINANDWEVDKISRLLTSLEAAQLGDRDLEDERVWNACKKWFSVKSFFHSFDQNGDINFPASFIWNSSISSKVFSSFAWSGGTVSLQLTVLCLPMPNGGHMCCQAAELPSGFLFVLVFGCLL